MHAVVEHRDDDPQHRRGRRGDGVGRAAAGARPPPQRRSPSTSCPRELGPEDDGASPPATRSSGPCAISPAPACCTAASRSCCRPARRCASTSCWASSAWARPVSASWAGPMRPADKGPWPWGPADDQDHALSSSAPLPSPRRPVPRRARFSLIWYESVFQGPSGNVCRAPVASQRVDSRAVQSSQRAGGRGPSWSWSRASWT